MLHEVQVSLSSWQLLQLVLLSSTFTLPFFTLHICLFQPLIFKLQIILPFSWLRHWNTFYRFFTIINISVIRERHSKPPPSSCSHLGISGTKEYIFRPSPRESLTQIVSSSVTKCFSIHLRVGKHIKKKISSQDTFKYSLNGAVK